MKLIATCALMALLSAGAPAVTLDSDNFLTIVLSDRTVVNLIGEASATSGGRTNSYYYLPTNLRLSQRPDRTPEFLFLKFTSDSRTGASGGLIHFLMEYGLTPAQETELREKVKQLNNAAVVKGAVEMEQTAEAGSFQIVSATLADSGMTKSLVTSGKAPLVSGGKAAAAARLNADGAQLLASTFEKARSITDLSIALNYNYTVLAPAAKGRITFDWSKLQREYDSLNAAYRQKATGRDETKFLGITINSTPTYSYSYEELHQQYSYLVQKEVIKIQFDELVADERVAKIREAFFQYFLNTMTEEAKNEDTPPPAPSDKEKEAVPNIRFGNRYQYNKTAIKTAFAGKTKVISLDYRMAIRKPYQLVGNLASWYDSVRDNPKCVALVDFNDPFYDHRDINFILDLDAQEIFSDFVNYVTVNVRKQRQSGSPFEDRMTIDSKYLKEKGVKASTTYARGEDRNPDLYEYKAQWSLRGGVLYPESPVWAKGDWEGVTLAAPVMPKLLEVEGDLDALRSSDITRVTVQVHYQRFGQETEENIQLSTGGQSPVVTKKLFLDRDAKGYAYRLIVNHKTEGKMVLPWSARVGDYYIYAAIPKELLLETELKQKAKETGAAMVNSAAEKVLDQFKNVLGGSK